MRSHLHAVVLPAEIAEFGDEIRRVYLELGRAFGTESLAGQCSPAIDVFETEGSIEVVVDLPGVDASTVRVLAKGDTLLIAGEKPPRRAKGDASYHLVERGFGRFARAVRLGRPCDVGRATSSLQNGELHVVVPKVAERRGRPIPIAVGAGREHAS